MSTAVYQHQATYRVYLNNTLNTNLIHDRHRIFHPSTLYFLHFHFHNPLRETRYNVLFIDVPPLSI